VTEINGLRLAYRGFVAGLAGGYVWAALAMVLAGLIHGDPLAPLRPIALAVSPLAGAPELSFVVGLAAVQAAGGVIGMIFAYFFGRFFTIRPTLVVAAPMVTLLVWVLVAAAVVGQTAIVEFATSPIGIVATIGYGLLIGIWIPVRGEVLRPPAPDQGGSPST
jgi:hypothetical protein